MSLPKNEAKFEFSAVGEVTQEQFFGDVTCVCVPTIAQRNLISREEMRIMGDTNSAPVDLQVRAIWLASLRYRIIEGPTWWKESNYGHTLMDDNILQELYTKVIEAEESWRKAVKQKADERKSGTQPPNM